MLVTALGPVGVGVGVEDDVELLERTEFDNVELGADFEEADKLAKGCQIHPEKSFTAAM